jgi:hypothetical protein
VGNRGELPVHTKVERKLVLAHRSAVSFNCESEPVALSRSRWFAAHLSVVSRVARIQPTTKDRLDLGLRLEGLKRGGRLRPSRIHESMAVQVSLNARDEVDSEVLELLEQAYDENC